MSSSIGGDRPAEEDRLDMMCPELVPKRGRIEQIAKIR
jgi:hypothetical protein